ncbi:MAG TPA: 2-hydroxy-3-oxopropionate reductase [Paenalcaligenes hominis]|uniref:2-hydroxy-3-oxopropionate reductase n=1 Tax=Paenalcaligenes hominis TaxID=643674 RepID=A0A9D2VEC0_9BURK|nr:2-hydroxy-3-oxopropionate reductase [Paenalcaligenes hominis]
MEKVAFIGLGIMGIPMCLNLIKGGHHVYANTRSQVSPEVVKTGATICPTPRSAAEAADIIILIVNDTPNVEEVLFGADGVTAAHLAGKLIIDMSTISPVATIDFAQKIKALGGDYLDAPVSGGDVGAKAASLSIMVGGSSAAFERALPLFQLMGQNITHVGDNGAGQITKMANQVIVALTIQAVAEGLVLASKAGADPEKVRQALLGGFANSRILEVHGKRMTSGQFDPGFKVNLHQKDITSALNTARELGVALPSTAVFQQLLSGCVARGGSDWDHSAIVKVLEDMSQHTLSQHE